MKPKIYLTLLIPVVVCAVIGIVIRLSYVPNSFGTESYRFQPWPVNAETVFSNNKMEVQNADDLMSYADLVIKCRYTGGQVISSTEYYIPVTVEEVYVGNKALLNQQIIIKEGIATFIKEKLINSYGGLFPIKQDEDYIMLLKKDNLNDYFNADDIRNSKYKVLTNSPFGMYRISDFKSTVVPPVDNSTNYSSYRTTYDFLVDSQATIDKYSLLRTQLLAELIKQ